MRIRQLLRAMNRFGLVSALRDSAGGVVGLSAGGSIVQPIDVPQNSYILLGDSRMAAGTVDGTYQVTDNARGVHNHLRAWLGSSMYMIRNAGIGENTSTQQLARLYDDVIAFRPGWVFYDGPTNDIGSVTSHATTISNVSTILQTLIAAGIKVATSTLPPRDTSTATQLDLISKYNSWIKAYCHKYGIPLADIYETVADPATGVAPPETHDAGSVHPTDYGAALQAMAWYNVLEPIIHFNKSLSSTAFDFDNLVYNGSGGGAASGSALPDGWTTNTANAGTPTVATVTRTDGVMGTLMSTTGTATAQGGRIGFQRTVAENINSTRANSTAYSLGQRRVMADGNQYVCTTAGTTAASSPTFDATIGATTTDGTTVWTRYNNFAAGDVCIFEAEYFINNVSGGNLGTLPVLQMVPTGASGLIAHLNPNDSGSRVPLHPLPGGILRSRPFIIPPGTTGYQPTIRCYLDNGTTATFQVGRCAIKHWIDPATLA